MNVECHWAYLKNWTKRKKYSQLLGDKANIKMIDKDHNHQLAEKNRNLETYKQASQNIFSIHSAS